MRFIHLLLIAPFLLPENWANAAQPLHKENVLGWELDVSPKGFIVKDGWVGSLRHSFAVNAITLVKPLPDSRELLMMSSAPKGQYITSGMRSFVLRAELDCKAYKMRIIEGTAYRGYFAEGNVKGRAPYPYPEWQTPARKSMPWYALELICPKDNR